MAGCKKPKKAVTRRLSGYHPPYLLVLDDDFAILGSHKKFSTAVQNMKSNQKWDDKEGWDNDYHIFKFNGIDYDRVYSTKYWGPVREHSVSKLDPVDRHFTFVIPKKRK